MPNSSDESAAEGVGLLQNDASDSETMSSGSEDGSDQGNGFLDVEASESGHSDSDDDSSDSDSDDASILGGGRRSRGPRAYFPHFKKLPIEMRHRIWQYFCPDLQPSPRVFSFQMMPSPKQSVISESATLENQIAHVNAMLGVHRESRELALKVFPDALAIRQGRGTVRFNKQRDVVLINGHHRPWEYNAFVPGFSEHVVNLALDLEFDESPGGMRILAAFPNLVNFYAFNWHNEGRASGSLRWCASDKTHRYEIQHLRKDLRVGEDLHFIYCFPDVFKHRNFAEKYASAADDAKEALETLVEEAALKDEDVKHISKLNFWRMTCFGWDAADRFPAFVAKYRSLDPDAPSEDGEDDEDPEDDDSDSDSDHNEYESDGIDDRPLDEQSLDEDDDPLDTRLESEDEEEGGASDFGGFSPLRGEDGSMLVDGDDRAAGFSSIEPDSDGGERRRRGFRRAVFDSEDEDEDDEVEEVTQGASSRAPVVPSDDEDEEEEKPSQSTNRRRRVVVSDDEDEEEEEEEEEKPARPAGRRARVLLSDDEDEDEDEGGAGVGGAETRDDSDEEPAGKPLSLAEKLQRNRRENPIPDEEDFEEESSEEESSEEEAPPKRVSLAQKLMAHRRRNLIEEEEEEGSEGSEDDDEDDEEDEDEDEDRNGMFMNMADEGESDDEEDQDDEDQY
ncbi:hypothetical protein CMUS01_15727 [Colletotrichum musicola]|uniref:2EXR domain-containing protein n=1 Tax=Colletotrichum musicola TaxID=2175873 RepID=A0A8H6IU15_9PEZI|nr:hypothetical protein CMUS01_15727 [Colletotrichum musicola]